MKLYWLHIIKFLFEATQIQSYEKIFVKQCLQESLAQINSINYILVSTEMIAGIEYPTERTTSVGAIA